MVCKEQSQSHVPNVSHKYGHTSKMGIAVMMMAHKLDTKQLGTSPYLWPRCASGLSTTRFCVIGPAMGAYG